VIIIYFLTGIMGTKEYRKPEWVTQMEELKEQLRGNDVAMSCMPEHGSSDNVVMSVDSLETESVHHQHVNMGPARKRPEVQLGSMPSLEDMSIGDDSVFVSNTSSCSDTLNCATVASSTVHVSATETPFLLDSPHPCDLGDNLQPSMQTALPENETISDVDTSSVSTGSDYAHLVMTDYLNSHRHSITAAIEALNTNSSVKGESDCASKVQNNSSGSNEHAEEFVSVEGPVLYLHERKEKSAEVLEIIYVSENENCDKSHPESSSFYLLSPIQESSEPSTESNFNGGSDGVGARNLDKHNRSTMKLLSASCEVISTTDASMTSHNLQTKYQTFPRSKVPVLNPMRTNACYSVTEDPTMYPLEPRELDPAGFHQLHTADSQEELQEFLLLESQCMTVDGQGLAAAFIVSDDEDDHSDEDCRCVVSGIIIIVSFCWVKRTSAVKIRAAGSSTDDLGFKMLVKSYI
jgi:hypothetical protein